MTFKMDDSIINGTVGEVFSYPEGPVKVEGTLTVADIDTKGKVITLGTEVGLGQQAIDALTGEEGAKTAASFTPDEVAAAKFLYLLPYVKKFGNAMGQKAAVRVLHAFCEYPIGDGSVKLQSPQERQLFDICQELLACKTTIVKYALDKQKSSVSTETNTAVAGGETNVAE